jgi:cell division protein FtsB
MANRSKTGRGTFSRLFMFCAIVCVAVVLVRMQTSVSLKSKELEALNDEIALQELINEDALRLLEIEDDKNFIEQVARYRFGYTYPDERVFIDRLGS